LESEISDFEENSEQLCWSKVASLSLIDLDLTKGVAEFVHTNNLNNSTREINKKYHSFKR
jgi:hypothetical protein